jgi:two-component sensor histidine kinase
VQALVEVHASHAARGGAPPEAKNALQRLVERLRAMTRVQSLLGARSGGPEAPVAIEGFLCALADGLAPLHHLPPGTLRCDVQPGVSLPYATAVPLGELVAELVGKACRYAYPADGNRLGPIRVACRREGQECVLVVEDEGVGMPAGHEAEGVGERLTRSLARQLGAARGVTWEPGPGGRGTRRLLRFPVPPETRGTLDIRELRAGGCGCPEGHGRPAPA